MGHDTLKAGRDKLLGMGAIVVAVRYLLFTLGVGSTITSYNFGSPRLATTTLLVLLGDLVRVAGFALVAVAFLTTNRDRARRIRSGAWVIAGGYFAIFASSAIAAFYHLSDSHLPLAGRMAGRSIAQTLAALAMGIAFTLTAAAFNPKRRVMTSRQPNGRDKHLAVASAGFVVGFALSVIGDLLGHAPAYELGADALLVVASVVAVGGFFGVADAGRASDSERLGRREGTLRVAAAAVALSGAFAVIWQIVTPSGLTLSYADPRQAVLGWANVLGCLCLLLAGLCALRAFALSRRSLLVRD